jgi:hypothetical protein
LAHDGDVVDDGDKVQRCGDEKENEVNKRSASDRARRSLDKAKCAFASNQPLAMSWRMKRGLRNNTNLRVCDGAVLGRAVDNSVQLQGAKCYTFAAD